MLQSDSFNLVDDFFAQGRFRDASIAATSARLDLQRANLSRFVCLMADISLHLDDLAAAAKHSERLLRETDNPSSLAIAHRVLAEISAHQLDFESSLGHFSAARALGNSNVTRGIRATVE